MTAESPHKPLPSHKANLGTGLQQVTEEAPQVTMASSALCVMTDFRKVPVATIGPDATLGQATEEMIAKGVRLLVVVDESRVRGLITARDTQGERPIQMVNERGMKHEDLRVRDLMAPVEDIDLLDMHRVMRADVGDIIATLKNWGRQHALVGQTNPETGETCIRGIFSATQIGRQLGLEVQTFDVARTFAQIQSALTKAY
ncbi:MULTISPECIES: CBS domain-containing protein [unclassified Thioalkalivibrio]|uniref:CBS domain-containing protein n=1 Tax=unclassified Thioalkalivibrio TaxID=2621013 RepID=UPI0003731536|nr:MULTISPECIES: CBS domain-containing protein [unclassified Thioalkalivibrio]